MPRAGMVKAHSVHVNLFFIQHVNNECRFKCQHNIIAVNQIMVKFHLRFLERILDPMRAYRWFRRSWTNQDLSQHVACRVLRAKKARNIKYYYEQKVVCRLTARMVVFHCEGKHFIQRKLQHLEHKGRAVKSRLLICEGNRWLSCYFKSL